MSVRIKSYSSPPIVLLSFNWEPAGKDADCLGIAIRCTPGFDGAASTRISTIELLLPSRSASPVTIPASLAKTTVRPGSISPPIPQNPSPEWS